MLVVVADPAQREHDDLLFCTDLIISPEPVASLYSGRWSIEITFRDTKQLLGGKEPQCWKAHGPGRPRRAPAGGLRRRARRRRGAGRRPAGGGRRGDHL